MQRRVNCFFVWTKIDAAVCRWLRAQEVWFVFQREEQQLFRVRDRCFMLCCQLRRDRGEKFGGPIAGCEIVFVFVYSCVAAGDRSERH